MNGMFRKTRRAWNDSGHAHFLTFSCFRRLPLLTGDRSRGWVIDAMRRMRDELDVSIGAYVIMPEHVHLLLLPRGPVYDMSRILIALKKPVAAAAHRHLEQTGNQRWLDRLTITHPSRRVFRFWQPGGGFDHNIVKERTATAVIDYIHANPIRRGQAATAVDWKWSSARYWAGHGDVPLEMDEVFGLGEARLGTVELPGRKSSAQTAADRVEIREQSQVRTA